MRDGSQTSSGIANALCGRTEAQRSDEPPTPRHRLAAYAVADHPSQGAQGSLRTAFAQVVGRTARVLEDQQADSVHLSGQDQRRAPLGSDDSAHLQDGSRPGTYQESRNTSHFAPQFRDRPSRSRRRSDGDQQAARAQQLYNNDDLFTLSARALGLDAQSDRLAPGAAVPALDRPVATVSQPRLDAREGPELSVANILKRYTPDFIGKYRPILSRQVESTLARLGFCRTAPMGGRTYACRQCQTTISLYNSCTDRHCPQCSGARRADWLDKAAGLLLPGVTYFQVVFTLPDKLSPLILGNRRQLYRTLMHAAWESLKQCIESKLGIRASAMMVLHTWNQRLGHHPHVHLLVPGSGPSLDGQRWIECQQTKPTGNAPAKPTLVDNKELGQEFSKRFLRKLNSLQRRGKLDLEGGLSGLQDPLAWSKFTDTLIAHDWCVFIERPPTAKSSPEHVLKYLARYMTGGPISDRRLVSCENDIVTFMARNKDKHSSVSQIPEKLSGVEFTRCWSLHILPKGFTKSRCFGGYSSARRTAFIAMCHQLRPPAAADEGDPKVGEANTAATDTPIERCCAKCQRPMQLICETRRPSWRDLFYGPSHHAWFES